MVVDSGLFFGSPCIYIRSDKIMLAFSVSYISVCLGLLNVGRTLRQPISQSVK